MEQHKAEPKIGAAIARELADFICTGTAAGSGTVTISSLRGELSDCVNDPGQERTATTADD
jgi:hypothetical protein